MKLVIFDMDGTLLDSQALIIRAMAGAFEDCGLPSPTAAAVLAIVGLSLPVAIGRLVPDGDQNRVPMVVAAYKDRFARQRADTGGEAAAPLFPGAREALTRLKARGLMLTVATGKARRGLDHALDGHDLRRYFAMAQTADDAPSKPDPAMVDNILRMTGHAAADAVMIGDTTYDIDMARAAGVRSIGVAWGYHPVAALRESGAAAIIDHFERLDATIEALS